MSFKVKLIAAWTTTIAMVVRCALKHSEKPVKLRQRIASLIQGFAYPGTFEREGTPSLVRNKVELATKPQLLSAVTPGSSQRGSTRMVYLAVLSAIRKLGLLQQPNLHPII